MSIFIDCTPECNREYPIKVCVLGCTGSVGTQTLDVCRNHSDKIQVVALAAHSSSDKVVEYAHEFGVKHIALANESCKNDSVFADLDSDVEVGFGQDAVDELVELDEVDVVVVSVVGNIGIRACYNSLKANKIVAVANKEPLVVGGELLMPLAKPGRLLPVDSEHSAIYQCLVGERAQDIYKIWLTCSGGPFFGKTRQDLAKVTVADALAHPSWSMGPKITIDSATLMNKGLEVIEAHHLFGVDIDDIEVLVHRQSKIHSMVEYSDGNVKALLGAPDMRGAIQYAISYPERWDSSIEHINFLQEAPLTFAAPDGNTFGCLELACEAGRVAGTLPCAMNAANEIANAAFRNGEIGFLDIEAVVRQTMDETNVERVENLDQLNEVDRLSREIALKVVNNIK